MDDPLVFEKYKNKRVVRVSHLSKCPTYTFRTDREDNDNEDREEVVYDENTIDNFNLGTKIHSVEEIGEAGAKFQIQAERTIYLYHKGLDFILRGTIDSVKIDLNGIYIIDFKSCKEKAFFFKIKQSLGHNHKTQLGCYKLIFYVYRKIEVDEGVICFITKENPRKRLSIPSGLDSLNNIEKFILSHPLVTLDESSLVEKTKEFLESGMGFVCKNCSLNNDCKFYKADQSALEDDEEKPSKRKSLKSEMDKLLA